MPTKRKFDNDVAPDLSYQLSDEEDSDGEDGEDEEDDFVNTAYLMHQRSYRNFLMIFILLFTTLNTLYFQVDGNKTFEVNRRRIVFEDGIVSQCTPAEFRKMYRMELGSFYKLHGLLKPQLDLIFFPSGGGKRDPDTNPYLISTKLRLSIALRYFAGGSPHDLKLIHGVSMATVFRSIWGVVDVNKSDRLGLFVKYES